VAEWRGGSRTFRGAVHFSGIPTMLTSAAIGLAACRASSPAPHAARPAATWTMPTRTASSTSSAGQTPPPAPTATPESETGPVVARSDQARPDVRSAQVPPEFPTHTTVQEPYLGKQLDLTVPLSPYFTSTPGLRREHEFARQLVQGVAQGLRSRHFRLEIRTGCPVENGGNVIVEGRALVRDRSGKVLAYSEQTGTGDSAGIWKLYYDGAARLRIAVFAWSNYMGQSAEGIITFEEAGRLARCSSPPKAEPPWQCELEGTTEDGVDPAVAGALRPEARPTASQRKRGLGPVDWAMSLVPTAAWSKCETIYRPHQ
jgi:hypothetical protein